MQKAAEAFTLYPDDDTIFSLYRILTYGQQRIIEGEQLYKQQLNYTKENFSSS